MAQIVPFPLDRVRKSKEDNIYNNHAYKIEKVSSQEIS